jgi:sulfur carrier protein ThiS adenylyltransferase
MSPSESTCRDRDLRQREIVPPQRLVECHGIVIGVGAIGRQVALQLAAIGMPRLTLQDDDTVQVENLAPQGYWPADLQSAKVASTARLCRQVNTDIEVTALAERFKRSSTRALPTDRRLIAFLCVDSIRTRRLIWEALRARAALFVDGRMSAEVVRVLTVGSPADDTYYTTTLFQQQEAYAGSCTAKSTIFTANIAAGLMVSQFARWLRQMPVDADLTLNLLASELTVHQTLPLR